MRYLGNYVHGLSKKPLSISVWKGFFSRLCGRNSDPWLAYALIKNNPEYAAKVPKGNPYHNATFGGMAIYCSNSMILRKVNRHWWGKIPRTITYLTGFEFNLVDRTPGLRFI
ncbi:uncharacterized protein LOC110867796 isoform X2 [Helianthus annuus]|uniref:uncharacterized protein LOC110867796 isoform X2 n=1 Tax=Helianthus annuus TaxID=4232 RepID=UPI000B8FE142|nr:uncharacterized protein LOC110867796 isoform X2 [Helianthus annuus]